MDTTMQITKMQTEPQVIETGKRLMVLCLNDHGALRARHALTNQGMAYVATEHRNNGQAVLIMEPEDSVLPRESVIWLWEDPDVNDFSLVPTWATPQVVRVDVSRVRGIF